METINTVLECLQSSDKPLRASEISSLTGLDKDAVNAALTMLKIERRISNPKRSYYTAN